MRVPGAAGAGAPHPHDGNYGFILFSSLTQEVEGFGAIDSNMLTKAAHVHKVYDLLAVTLQTDQYRYHRPPFTPLL